MRESALPRSGLGRRPTYPSWLDQVERSLGHIAQRATRRGSFRTVREVVRRIDAFVEHYDAGAGPFAWTAAADSALATLERFWEPSAGPHTRRGDSGMRLL